MSSVSNTSSLADNPLYWLFTSDSRFQTLLKDESVRNFDFSSKKDLSLNEFKTFRISALATAYLENVFVPDTPNLSQQQLTSIRDNVRTVKHDRFFKHLEDAKQDPEAAYFGPYFWSCLGSVRILLDDLSRAVDSESIERAKTAYWCGLSLVQPFLDERKKYIDKCLLRRLCSALHHSAGQGQPLNQIDVSRVSQFFIPTYDNQGMSSNPPGLGAVTHYEDTDYYIRLKICDMKLVVKYLEKCLQEDPEKEISLHLTNFGSDIDEIDVLINFLKDQKQKGKHIGEIQLDIRVAMQSEKMKILLRDSGLNIKYFKSIPMTPQEWNSFFPPKNQLPTTQEVAPS